MVYRYDAPLFFANAEDFRRRALAAADQAPEPARWFVLNVKANVEVDYTALEAADLAQGTGLTPAVAAVVETLAEAVIRDIQNA